MLSQAIIDEIQDVLFRRSLIRKYKYTPQAVTHLINLLTQGASIVEVPSSFALCRDVDDDPFIDCAIFGRVQFLVSCDKHIIGDPELAKALFEYGVKVIDPPAFLEKIRETEINKSDLDIRTN